MNHIEKIINPYKGIMSQAADIIVTEDVSRYPIFIMFQSEVHIGIPVVSREQHGSDWNIHASTLEEFYTKKLIEADKIDEFRSVYKKHETELCIFVLSEDGANFVFLPA